MQTSEIPLADP